MKKHPAFCLLSLFLLLPVAAAELRVDPFTPGPGDAAAFRQLAGEPEEGTPARRLEQLKSVFSEVPREKKPGLAQLTGRLEGKRIGADCTKTVNSLAFAAPEKRELRILVWNSGRESAEVNLAVAGADRFFGVKPVRIDIRILTSARDLYVTEKKTAVSGQALKFGIPLAPGSAALAEVRPEEKTEQVDGTRSLTFRFDNVPGSGHFRIHFNARADVPHELDVEVRFMQRERFRGIRKFSVMPGKEWKGYGQIYPIPAGTLSVVCKVTGGPAELRAFEGTE